MHRACNSARAEAGFSLVEVLCAMAIAASAIAVLLGGINGSLRGAARLEQHLGARIILSSILSDELSAANTQSDRREGQSGPYRWRLDIAPARLDNAPAPPFRIYRLTATVRWGTGGELSATTLKLGR